MSEKINLAFHLYVQDPPIPEWEPEENVIAWVDYRIHEDGTPDPQIYLPSDELPQIALFQKFMEASDKMMGQRVAIHPRYVLVQGDVPEGREAAATMIVRQQGGVKPDGTAVVYIHTETDPKLSPEKTNGVINTLALIGYAIQNDD